MTRCSKERLTADESKGRCAKINLTERPIKDGRFFVTIFVSFFVTVFRVTIVVVHARVSDKMKVLKGAREQILMGGNSSPFSIHTLYGEPDESTN